MEYDAVECKCPVCGGGAYRHTTDYGSHKDAWVECNSPSCESHNMIAAEKDTAMIRELAMEAGMLHGVEAYNDIMGY